MEGGFRKREREVMLEEVEDCNVSPHDLRVSQRNRAIFSKVKENGGNQRSNSIQRCTRHIFR